MQGALGHGDRDNRAVPSKILGLVGLPVGQIAAGGNHSLAVTCTGRVYAVSWFFMLRLAIDYGMALWLPRLVTALIECHSGAGISLGS